MVLTLENDGFPPLAVGEANLPQSESGRCAQFREADLTRFDPFRPEALVHDRASQPTPLRVIVDLLSVRSSRLRPGLDPAGP